MTSRTDSPEYRKHYNWGWRYSQGGSATLDYVDSKYGNPPRPGYDAALDGYLDAAASRPKWHRLHCPDHDHCEDPPPGTPCRVRTMVGESVPRANDGRWITCTRPWGHAGPHAEAPCNAGLRAPRGGYATCDLAKDHTGPHHGVVPW